MRDRAYLERHGFLDFKLPPGLMENWRLWQMVGEIASKCDHVAGVPLKPDAARQLMRVYLTKGAHATTAIEGNTLSFEDVAALVDGRRTQPPSREYLETEVLNVLGCLTELGNSIQDGRTLPMDLGRLCELNQAILHGTEHEPNAVPGQLRAHAVAVPTYLAVPAEDVAYLTQRTLEWTTGLVDSADIVAEARFGQAVIAAVVAHAYLAWIHPFGDGNGRTARLVEAQLLARTGRVPLPAVNLLSDHYNRTRDRYFRMFNEARESRDLSPFIIYAVEGFRDGLREQVALIREEQLRITWQNYVHEAFDDAPRTETRSRQKELVFALTAHGRPATRPQIERMTPTLAVAYDRKGDRTLSRDLNDLTKLGLLRRDAKGVYASNQRIIEAWLPPTLARDRGR